MWSQVLGLQYGTVRRRRPCAVHLVDLYTISLAFVRSRWRCVAAAAPGEGVLEGAVLAVAVRRCPAIGLMVTRTSPLVVKSNVIPKK